MNEKLKVIISAEIDKLKQGVQDAKKAMNDFKSDTDKVSKQVDANMKSMGTAAVNGMKALGTALAAGGAALIAANAATEDYRQGMSNLKLTYEDVGLGASAAAKAQEEFYKITGDADVAFEAASLLGQLANSEEDISTWADIAAGAQARFHDSISVEGLIEAANETANTGVVTGQFADLLNWASKEGTNFAESLSINADAQAAFNQAVSEGASVEDAFNAALAACETQSERNAIITAAMDAGYGDLGESAREANSAIEEQRAAQNRLMGVMSQIGAAMAPVVTGFMDFATKALQPVIDKIAPLAEQYGPQLAEAMGQAGEAVGNAFGFFVDHWEIFAALAGIIAGIAAAIGLYNAVAAVKAAMDALQVTSLTALIAAQWAHVTATAAALAPYLLIVAAIAAVIAIIVLCVKHWDEIREVIAKVAEKIKEIVSKMVDAVVKFFTDLMTKISEKIEGIKTAATEKFQAIKNAISEKVQAAKDAVITTFENIKSGIQSRIDAAKNAVSNVFNSIKSTITTVLNAAKSTVTSVFDGIKTGITDKINAAKTAVSNAINAIKGFFNFSWSLPKLKLPHISISGSFSINPPSVPKFSISWYKLGGVFDSPALFPYGNGQIGGLGEAGAEAIVPLEKNTKWLDKIAERLGAGQSAKIVLEVDGKVFAQTAISSINDLTRQQGKLSLNIV